MICQDGAPANNVSKRLSGRFFYLGETDCFFGVNEGIG